MNSNFNFRSAVSTINRICCALLCFFFLFGMAVEGETMVPQIIRLAKYGCLLSPVGLFDIFVLALIFSVAMFFLRGAWGNKAPEWFNYKVILAVTVVYGIAAIGTYALKENEYYKLERLDYLPEVSEGAMKTAKGYENLPFDETEIITVRTYTSFLSEDFSDEGHFEIVTDESLGDRVEIVVKYKGVDCEVSTYFYKQSEYQYMDSDELNIAIYPEDYNDYEVSRDDFARYYSQGINVEYTDRYAMVEITVITAHPDKFVTED